MANQKIVCQVKTTVAPVLQKRDQSRGHQDKSDYYDHLVGGYQGGEEIKGWSKDELLIVELKEVYSRYRKKNYANICSSAQTGKQVGTRGFFFDESEWQNCPEEILNNISKTRGCMEPGKYRVTKPDDNGVRDIIFMEKDTPDNYKEKAREVIKKNYLYGGKFRVIDKRRKKMCIIKVKTKDLIYDPKNKKDKKMSKKNRNDVGKVGMLGDCTELYEVIYCMGKKS